jgi:hypothetical protein
LPRLATALSLATHAAPRDVSAVSMFFVTAALFAIVGACETIA